MEMGERKEGNMSLFDMACFFVCCVHFQSLINRLDSRIRVCVEIRAILVKKMLCRQLTIGGESKSMNTVGGLREA